MAVKSLDRVPPSTVLSMHKLTSRRKLLALSALLLAGGVGAYGLTQIYLSTTSNFVVGTNLQAALLAIAYDANAPAACTLTSFPAWTCPTPTGLSGDIFSGDVVSYEFLSESDRSGQLPAFAITAGTFTGFTTGASFATCTSMTWASCGSISSGLPTMTPGTWYEIILTATITPTAPTGSVSFNVQYGV